MSAMDSDDIIRGIRRSCLSHFSEVNQSSGEKQLSQDVAQTYLLLTMLGTLRRIEASLSLKTRIIDGAIGQIMLLEVAPTSFDVIQLGGVFRQPFEGEPGARGERTGC